jgi:hypothetical protein
MAPLRKVGEDNISSRIIDNGIFQGIDACGHRKTRTITGFSRLV